MEKLTDEMAEFICGKICRYPYEISDQEQLEEKCCECKMGSYVCQILNKSMSENAFEYLATLKNEDHVAGVVKAKTIEEAKTKVQQCYKEHAKLEVIPIQFEDDGLCKIIRQKANSKQTVQMELEDIAAVVINVFMESCIEKAKNNWCPSQVEMLERLFKCEIEGKEYGAE